MRIITGRFRRRKLLTNAGQVTRPITDRVKQSLFQFLIDELPEARVADIFAGTGTLGLEALSRGAHSVVFIERDRKAWELLQKNVDSLKVEDETLCWKTDAVMSSFRPKGCDDFLPFDVIFFDPPYKMVADIVAGSALFKALERLARESVSAENATLLLRTPTQSVFEMPDAWEVERTINYSTMDVHWFRKSVVGDEPVVTLDEESDSSESDAEEAETQAE